MRKVARNIKVPTVKSSFVKVCPRHPHWLPKPFRKGWLLSLQINRTVSSVLSTADIERLDAIEGHLNYREGMTLFALAYNALGNGRIVEIGSFKGKSTSWMATGLKLAEIEDKVVAIDPKINVGDIEAASGHNEKTCAEVFWQNLTHLGLSDYVEPVPSTSNAAAVHWSGPIRLLLIDGSHRYEDVLSDLTLWVPWVERGG
ncbi:MAG: class I SAM-dependent methyltransferase, partial [Planctomycetota bacterium]